MSHEAPEVLTPTEARQASPRKMNFRVLVWSLALAIVAAAVLYTVFFSAEF
jgi:type VI protein secretion system component VasF